MKKILPILILLILSFFTIKPLFYSGFFAVHDNVQVERVYEMVQAIKDGQFPVRMVKDLGYGYGYSIFNFYAPLPYYTGAFFHLIGVDVITSTKLMFIIGILLAGISMFFLARQFWGIWGALLSAILYQYAPYHALDIYVRGAVGEFWAMGFLPLVFLGMYKIYKKENTFGLIIGSVGLAGAILSHNLTALMLIPFFLLYFLILLFFSHHRKSVICYLLSIICLGLALSAFYWLPALLEMKYTNVYSQIGGGADFRSHFVFLDQLWDFPWGFGGSAGRESGISFKIGKPNVIFWFLSILLFLLFIKRHKKYKPIFSLGIIGFFLAIFFTNKISQPVWEMVTPMVFIQYPWRFVEFAVFFSSLLGGFILYTSEVASLSRAQSRETPRRWIWRIGIMAIFLTIFFHSKYFTPQRFTNFKPDYYTNLFHLNWQASKISDEYLPKSFPVPKNQSQLSKEKVITSPKILIKSISSKSNEEVLVTSGDTFSTISLLRTNFPGWQVEVDGKNVLLADSPYLTFTIVSGKHEIRARFINTPVRSFSNLLSLLGIISLGVILTKIKYAKSF